MSDAAVQFKKFEHNTGRPNTETKHKWNRQHIKKTHRASTEDSLHSQSFEEISRKYHVHESGGDSTNSEIDP